MCLLILKIKDSQRMKIKTAFWLRDSCEVENILAYDKTKCPILEVDLMQPNCCCFEIVWLICAVIKTGGF